MVADLGPIPVYHSISMIIYVYILICAYTVNQLVGLIASNSQFSSFKSHVVLLNYPFLFFPNVDQNSQFSPIANSWVQSSFSMIFHDFPWFSMIFHDFPWFSIIFPTPVAFPLFPRCAPPGCPVPTRRLAALGDALALLLGVLAIEATSFAELVLWSALGTCSGALRQGLQAVIQAEPGDAVWVNGLMGSDGLYIGYI